MEDIGATLSVSRLCNYNLASDDCFVAFTFDVGVGGQLFLSFIFYFFGIERSGGR